MKADTSCEKIQELLNHAMKTSPVMDNLRKPVPIGVELQQTLQGDRVRPSARPSSSLRNDAQTVHLWRTGALDPRWASRP